MNPSLPEQVRGSIRIARVTSLFAVILAIVVSLGLMPATKADAQILPGGTAGFTLNLDEPGLALRVDYATLLDQVRRAVSTHSSDGGLQTQSENGTLITVRLVTHDDSGAERSVSLIIRPSNLYVIGWSNPQNRYPFILDDESYPTNHIWRAGFGGNYNDLTQAAGRGRSSLLISFNDVRASIIRLATTTNARNVAVPRQESARALSLLIQMVSEAARFSDVEWQFSQVFHDWSVQHGLPDRLSHIENNWGTLSNYFYRARNNGSGNVMPLYIEGYNLFRNAEQVRQRVPVMLGSTTGHLGYGPGRDEL